MAGFSNDANLQEIMFSDNLDFTGAIPPVGNFTANGQLAIGSTAAPHIRVNTLTPGVGVSIVNGPGTITISGTGALTDLHVARFIVSAGGASDGANYTTIAAAYAAAVGTGIPQTVFIQPGTYTENITLTGGVNIASFGSDGQINTGSTSTNVTIVGSITANITGHVVIYGVQLKTNGSAAIITSGTNTGQLDLNDCSLFANDATGVTLNNANNTVTFTDCFLTSTSTNILFTVTTGTINFGDCRISLPGSAGTSTLAATTCKLMNCLITGLAISTSTTGNLNVLGCSWGSTTNTTALTMAGTGNSTIANSTITSGTASAISIGSGCTCAVYDCFVSSSNTNAITGSGTLNYGIISFSASNTVNVTTQNGQQTLVGTSGTFTPTLIGASTAGTTTYVAQTGYYTRIGNLVSVFGYISLSAATGTGIVQLGGLPFTIKNQSNFFPNGSIFWNGGASWVFPAGTTAISVLGTSNTATSNVWANGTASAGGFVSMANASLQLSYSLSYQI